MHLLDGAKPLDEILDDKATIEGELRAWNAKLLEKPTLLVLNKLDLPDARQRLIELREQFPEIRGISAATQEGVRDLLYTVERIVENAPVPEIVEQPPAAIELTPVDAFILERGRDGAFELSGERIERLGGDDELRFGRVARALRTRTWENGRRQEIARNGSG